MNRAITLFHQYWLARQPREQKAILIGAVTVCVLGIYLGIYEPAATGIAQLKNALPISQQQALQLEQLAQQAKLKGVAYKPGYANASSIQTSLAQAGLNGKVSQTQPWTVHIEAASGDALWQWLKSAPVSQAQFSLGKDGAWQGDMTIVAQ